MTDATPFDREFVRRLTVGLFVLGLLLVVAYAALAFLAVVVFAVFLYYAVRPVFRSLDRFGLSRRLRALLSLAAFGVPFLVLLGYTVAVIALEVQAFLEQRGLLEDATQRIAAELNIAGLDLSELETLVGNGTTGQADVVLQSLLGAASAVGSAIVQFILIVVLVYYMLVEGPDLVAWLLDTYDDSGILRAYARAVDPELSKTLFGNIVTIFITAILAIGTFYTFNAFVPPLIEIPFPALAGALAGACSLIPVIGIKIVYIPITVGLGANAWLADEPELLGPLVVLAVVSAVLVDFVPDIFVRAKVSSEQTHDGLLIVAYIVGPALFGFYGLFLAPVILIATTNATRILLPYALSGEVPTQTTLTESVGDVAVEDAPTAHDEEPPADGETPHADGGPDN
jgi:predicted PurR-regulated permease PerM